MKKTLAVVGLAIAFTAGCGGGATEGPSAKPSAAPGTASAKPSATPATTPAPQPLSKKALTASLLSIDALPVGYSQDPPSPDTADKTFCDYKVPHEPTAVASRDFTKGSGLSSEFASTTIRQYATAKEAAESFAALADTLATCKSETYDGSKLTYTLMSTPKVGDKSIGVRIESDGSTILNQFALSGPALVNAGIGAIVNVNGDDAAAVFEAQVKKYEAASR